MINYDLIEIDYSPEYETTFPGIYIKGKIDYRITPNGIRIIHKDVDFIDYPLRNYKLYDKLLIALLNDKVKSHEPIVDNNIDIIIRIYHNHSLVKIVELFYELDYYHYDEVIDVIKEMFNGIEKPAFIK